MANKFQVKRTSTTGRTPNTTNSSNTRFIDTGELALNLTDRKLFSSNGSVYFEVGANLVNLAVSTNANVGNVFATGKVNATSYSIGSSFVANTIVLTTNTDIKISANDKKLSFETVGGAESYFVLQNDDNFVYYSTNTSNLPRPVLSIYANSVTSNLQILVPLELTSGAVANGTLGTSGQVLKTSGSGVYWGTVSGGGGSSVTMSNTAPGGAGDGDQWWDTDSGRLYIYYNDGTSSQWVDASPSIPGPAGTDGTDGTNGTDGLDGVGVYAANAYVQMGSFGVGTPASGVLGEIRAAATITAFYSSDERLKKNITSIDNPIGKVMAIRGVTFEWTDEEIERRGGVDGKYVRSEEIGVVAQEIEKVLPQIVAERPDGYKAVRYEMIVPLLIESIKDQQKQIDELKQIIRSM